MAVLSKIRERSILLIGIIGFCLLAFIVGDVIRNGGFGIKKNVGSVNGTDIAYMEFNQKVANIQQNQRGSTMTQAASYLWNMEISRILFEERFEKAGIRVGKDQVIDLYGQYYGQNPQFMNAAGKFDKAKFNEYLVNLKKNDPAAYANFENSRPEIEAAAKRQFYTSMLRAGYFTTNFEAEQQYAAENNKANFDYVYVPYTTVNDEDPKVKVTDEEIIAYMKKNQKKYKAEETRDLEFVYLENKASAQDEAEIKKNVESFLQPQVKFNKDTNANDTIPAFANVPADKVEEYVNLNSEIKYDTAYVKRSDLPVEFAQQISSLAPGQVFGPYTNNSFYTITRMIDKKPGATAKVSHILIGYKGSQTPNPNITRTKEEAKAKADELLAQVNANPDSFGQLVAQNSDDTGSVGNQGIYDNVTPGQMVKPFDNFLFNNPIGKTGVVETDFGFHVIKVLDKYEGVRIASIAQRILPSEATVDANFTKAAKLEMDARDSKTPFADLAKTAGLTVTPANGVGVNEENIPGVGQDREIVRWAYNKDTKVGDVKKFDTTNGTVVAQLKTINEKGVLPLEQAKQTVLPILRNEKKAAVIREKMKGSTLEAVSQSSGSSIATASGVTMASPMVPGVGPEMKVVGKAFGLAAGKTSQLIDGNGGVFMIRVKNVENAPKLTTPAAMVSRLNNQGRGGIENRLTVALKDAADIEDDRASFY